MAAAIGINSEKPQFIVLDGIFTACWVLSGVVVLVALLEFPGRSDPAALSTSPCLACKKGLPACLAGPELWEMLFSPGKGQCGEVGAEICVSCVSVVPGQMCSVCNSRLFPPQPHSANSASDQRFRLISSSFPSILPSTLVSIPHFTALPGITQIQTYFYTLKNKNYVFNRSCCG